MSIITYKIQRDEREYWTRTYEVTLDTEDFEDKESMDSAAYDAINDDEGRMLEEEKTNWDSDDMEIVETDYDEDEKENYKWYKEDAEPINKPEDIIKW